jgi:uncharacterized protein YajQ (UPF0234 family)
MAQQNTFDIVSTIDLAEVVNAINQALKEVQTRFDFKGSQSNIEMEGKDAFILTSDDEYKLRSLDDILQSKFVKRGVPLKGLTYQKIEQALGGNRSAEGSSAAGHSTGEGQGRSSKYIKDTKLKVQASIQEILSGWPARTGIHCRR